MSKILTITKKELWSYFATPTALIFLGAYLFASLFSFFWVEKFFSRNIADLRPLFEMTPLLMIFLIATLTMKMWSEEKKIGTIEFLMTLPIKTAELVLGKFLACLFLVSTALILSLGLVYTVSSLGHIDWGPVIGAYFASLLLASAYISIGLYVSSRTESQIFSMIVTCLLCLVFYLVGSDVVVSLLGQNQAELLKLFGSGSRFSSISRGVLDFRDIYYYISISLVFLALNTYSIEKSSWSTDKSKASHTNKRLTIAMLMLNFVFANFWLYKVHTVRWDLTEKKIYSISPATQQVLSELNEPLLLRGYFSERTHPLLAPLVPMIKDLMNEYKLAGQKKVRVEVLDPRTNPEIEAEAHEKYQIKPVPFQIADRHSSSLVNSYFNIVVQYGDQFETLDFGDLIKVHARQDKLPDVRLKNLEYDLTSRIKKVFYAFNHTDSLFASIDKPIEFTGYISSESIPEKLKILTQEIKKSLSDYQKRSGGKLKIKFLDPSKDESLAEKISDDYGFSPQSTNLLSEENFYYYLTLKHNDKMFALGVPENLDVSSFNQDMEATLKRLAPGFLKTVGIYTPPANQQNQMMAQFGMGTAETDKSFEALKSKLDENYRVQAVDLDSGVVNSEIDTLLVVAPKNLNNKQLFAIDQYLMKGASVIVLSSPIAVTRNREGFESVKYHSGLEKWLEHHGAAISKELAMDKNNAGFPDIRRRNVRGVTIKEAYLAPYPLFIDVREQGLNQKLALTAEVEQLIMPWASPIKIDEKKNENRNVYPLIQTSNNAWTTEELSIRTNREDYPENGFPSPKEKAKSTLAVMIEGEFTSFFKGKKSPLLQAQNNDKSEKNKTIISSVIEKSPKIARLIVYASNELVSDDTLQLNGMVGGTQYLNSLQLVENSIDWSVQDKSLLSMRSRNQFARTLLPLSDREKTSWEYFNYLFALCGLLVIYGLHRYLKSKTQQRFRKLNIA